MKLIYGITVSTEINEIKKLLEFLTSRTHNMIVVQRDLTKESTELIDVLSHFNVVRTAVPFENHFGSFKNYLTDTCQSLRADYVFQLDADEMITEYMVDNIDEILLLNPHLDMIRVPRINTVDGITKAHLTQWNWMQNEKGHINFPDYQGRIYRSNLRWFRAVHEEIFGAENFSSFPPEENYCILHHKKIDKQVQQNAFYSKIK